MKKIAGSVNYGDHDVLLDPWLSFSQTCNQIKKIQGGYGLCEEMKKVINHVER